MARKKVGKSEKVVDGRTAKGFGDWSFVKHSLSRDEKAGYEQFCETFSEHWDVIERLIDSDYKLSVNYDEYNSCITASLACRAKAHDDFGLILTARAPDAYNAVTLLLYKHLVLLADGWMAWHEREAGSETWG